MQILDKVNSPEDIKGLDIKSLNILSGEIREFLVEKVSKTGGHLASNLGVVELTLALHKVFDMPKDKIVWDVGHQAYVHKIITGRRDEFDTLRKYNGLSGFPKPDESEYDVFKTGHSSTSISAALGMAKARDILGEKHNVVAVIGDGALTGGMAFEALNDAGISNTDLIVILNDNEMSIAHNVGGMASYLSKIRTDPKYINLRDDIEELVKRIPKIGNNLFHSAKRLKESLKYFVVEGMIFEELGFTYLGPIDGHNIQKVIDVLKRAKTMKKPVFVHVVTKKGKGYVYAEENPDVFHGVGPFEIETGEGISKGTINYSRVFGEEIVKEAEKNEKIVAITAAMPDGTGLKDFALKFPKRFFDVGIAEQHAVTFASGLASSGLKPVFAVYSTFLQRGYDQIIHDMCLQNLPVTLCIDRAGIVGEDGETHQGVFDIGYLRSIPNLTLLTPKDIQEFRMMLKFAFGFKGPIALRYPRGGDNDINFEIHDEIRYGKWEKITDGESCAVLACGKMVQMAYQAVLKLRKNNINAQLINCRFIKPLDEEMLSKIFKDHDKIFTFEDNYKNGGFGSSIAEYAFSKRYKGCIIINGYPDEFIPQGKCSILYKKYNLDSEGILNNILVNL